MVLGEIVVGGPAAVWLYAAIRPRFGSGPRTAMIAALWVWFVTGPYVQAMFLGMGALRLVSLSRLMLVDVIGAVPIVVGILVGAWIYREEEAATAAVAAR